MFTKRTIKSVGSFFNDDERFIDLHVQSTWALWLCTIVVITSTWSHESKCRKTRTITSLRRNLPVCNVRSYEANTYLFLIRQYIWISLDRTTHQRSWYQPHCTGGGFRWRWHDTMVMQWRTLGTCLNIRMPVHHATRPGYIHVPNCEWHDQGGNEMDGLR